MSDLLAIGTPVQWNQRQTGEAKHGTVVLAYHGLYGPTYWCRAHNWSKQWHTTVVGLDLTVQHPTEPCPRCGNAHDPEQDC